MKGHYGDFGVADVLCCVEIEIWHQLPHGINNFQVTTSFLSLELLVSGFLKNFTLFIKHHVVLNIWTIDYIL
jgi:hypothetical protein